MREDSEDNQRQRVPDYLHKMPSSTRSAAQQTISKQQISPAVMKDELRDLRQKISHLH
jgi:hypothetical protein